MLRETAAFRRIDGLAFTKRSMMKMRDKSSKERLITKERRPLTVPRKITSGTGLISIAGREGSLGNSIFEYATRGEKEASRGASSRSQRRRENEFPVRHNPMEPSSDMAHHASCIILGSEYLDKILHCAMQFGTTGTAAVMYLSKKRNGPPTDHVRSMEGSYSIRKWKLNGNFRECDIRPRGSFKQLVS